MSFETLNRPKKLTTGFEIQPKDISTASEGGIEATRCDNSLNQHLWTTFIDPSPYTPVTTYWGPVLTYSFWVRVFSFPTSTADDVLVAQYINEWAALEGTGFTAGTFTLDIWNDAESLHKQFRSTGQPLAGIGVWHHVAVAIDTNQTEGLVYIDGVSVPGTWLNDFSNGNNIDAGSSTGRFGLATHATFNSPGSYADICISEFWASKEYIDLSDPTNLERFRTSGGAAANLGADGSLASPTSLQPVLYQNLATTDVTGNTANAGQWPGVWEPKNSPTECVDTPTFAGGDIVVPNVDDPELTNLSVTGGFKLKEPNKSGKSKILITTDGDYPIEADTGVTFTGDNTLRSSGQNLLTVQKFGNGKTVATLEPVDGTSGTVQALPRPYDFAAQSFGEVTSGAIMFRYIAPRDFILFDYGHQADSETRSPVDMDFSVTLNDVEIGTFRYFAAGTSTVAFNFVNSAGYPSTGGSPDGVIQHNITRGDVLKIIAPAYGSPLDQAIAGFEDVSITLRGVVEPVAPSGSLSVAFGADPGLIGTGGVAVPITITGEYSYIEYAVIAYSSIIGSPPGWYPLDDQNGVLSAGDGLIINGTLLTSESDYTTATNDTLTVTKDTGADDIIFRLQATAFGPGGIATDYIDLQTEPLP